MFGALYQKHLKALCDSAGATEERQKWLLTAYELLGRTIRNRDAHGYVPNVRGDHFELVSDLFIPCFDLLVSWLPDGPATVNKWREPNEARMFIRRRLRSLGGGAN